MPIPKMSEMIDRFGVWCGGRPCGRCGNRKLFQIQYGDTPKDSFVVCQFCDTSKETANV